MSLFSKLPQPVEPDVLLTRQEVYVAIYFLCGPRSHNEDSHVIDATKNRRKRSPPCHGFRFGSGACPPRYGFACMANTGPGTSPRLAEWVRPKCNCGDFS